MGIVYDAVEGMNFYRDFGLLDALFTNPTFTAIRRHRELLRSYVRDSSITPAPPTSGRRPPRHGRCRDRQDPV